MLSIASQLEGFTAGISKFETSRDYISMSHAAMDDDEIKRTIEEGFVESTKIRLKCYKGYQMERDLLNRLQMLFKDRIKTGIEYKAFEGIVKGHPDLRLIGIPGDCKTVPLEEHLPENNRRVSRKIYFQMQAYMLYGKKEKAVVLFEARDTGALRDYWFTPDRRIMDAIDSKYRNLVTFWKERKGVISA